MSAAQAIVVIARQMERNMILVLIVLSPCLKFEELPSSSAASAAEKAE
jgi:hypothetical protein